MKHRLHVVGLPHTETTRAFHSCAYTQKIRKFSRMMHERGHIVYLYSGTLNDAPCTEHIQLVQEDVRLIAVGNGHYTAAPWTGPAWDLMNKRAIEAIRVNIQPGDILCIIGGNSQKVIADAFPDNPVVECGIGYGGTFANFRIFESYAWMHMVYGSQCGGNPHNANGRFYDAVIPGYLEPEDFARPRAPDDYLLYVGRMIDRKGLRVVHDVAQATGRHVIFAGPGGMPEGITGEYLGEIEPARRITLMAGAHAVMMPTIYVEPFGNVAMEAMACGAPVITTDWGSFTENVLPGLSGVRCHTLRDFVAAVDAVPALDRNEIQHYARDKFGFNAVGAQYERYFGNIDDLHTDGWYAK